MLGVRQSEAVSPPEVRAEWPFVGRDAELEVVTGALGRDRTGTRGAVVVAPAGVGKSRLLREVRGWADRQGFRTATVIATEAASLTPYGAVLHLLPQGEAAPVDRASWHAAFASALRSDGEGTILLVDDAQHLDRGSAALLLQLVVEGVVAPVVAARRGDGVPDPVTSLWKDGLCLRVDLQPFSAAEMRELIARALDGPVSERTLARLAAKSDGNVLFARELVSAAVEGGSLRRRDGVWVWDESVVLAPRLVDAVGQRLRSLSEAQRRALALLALGEPLPLAVAERLTSLELLSSLEELGLVRADGSGDRVSLRLGHPLYGEVVLDHVGQLGRRRLAISLAEAFEDDPEHVAESLVRVVTWRLDAGRPSTSVELLSAAGRANQTFDHELAARLARAALDTLEEGEEQVVRATVVVELARALVGCNEVEEAHRMLVEVEDDVLAAADAHLLDAYIDIRFWASCLGMGRAEEMRVLLDRCLEAPVPDEGQRTARVAAYRASILLGEGRPGAALSMAEPLLDLPALPETGRLLALGTTGEALGYLGLHDRTEEVWDRMRELTSQIPVRTGVAAVEVELQALFTAQLDGRVSEALPAITSLHRQVESSQDVVNRGLASLALGRCLMMAGHLERARNVLLDAMGDLRKVDLGGSLAWALILLAQVNALTGRVTESTMWRDEAMTRLRTVGTARESADFVTAEVWLKVARSDRTGAIALAREGAERFGEMDLPRAWLLHLACRVGDRSRDVVAGLRDIAARVECSLPALLADHAEAARSEDGRALEALAERFAQRGLLLLAAEAANQAAAAHRSTGHLDRARRAGGRAAALREQFDPVSTPALEDAGALPALSRREHDVAMLAAAGLSNAAIAEQLVVSVRTVESHLYQTFAKLGIDSRSDLGRFLPAAQRGADQ